MQGKVEEWKPRDIPRLGRAPKQGWLCPSEGSQGELMVMVVLSQEMRSLGRASEGINPRSYSETFLSVFSFYLETF